MGMFGGWIAGGSFMVSCSRAGTSSAVTVGHLVLRPQILFLGFFPLHACSYSYHVQTICTTCFFLLFYHLIKYSILINKMILFSLYIHLDFLMLV